MEKTGMALRATIIIDPEPRCSACGYNADLLGSSGRQTLRLVQALRPVRPVEARLQDARAILAWGPLQPPTGPHCF